MAGLIGIGKQTHDQAVGGLMGAARSEAARNAANQQLNAVRSANRQSTAGTLGGMGYKLGMKYGQQNLANYASATGQEIGKVGFRDAFMSQIPGTKAAGLAAAGKAGAAGAAAPNSMMAAAGLGQGGTVGALSSPVAGAANPMMAAAGLGEGAAAVGASSAVPAGAAVGSGGAAAAGGAATAGGGGASTLATLGAAAPWALAAVGVGLLVSKLFD